MRIKNVLQKLMKLINALSKIIPTLIEVLEDLADDGKLNKSNTKPNVKK